MPVSKIQREARTLRGLWRAQIRYWRERKEVKAEAERIEHSGKFKLVVMKAESTVMSDPEWLVCGDLGIESTGSIAAKINEVYHKAKWEAEDNLKQFKRQAGKSAGPISPSPDMGGSRYRPIFRGKGHGGYS